MAVSRGLIISLGVSALSCTILFLYFRNKITNIERKVDVMFDLIQNHEAQQQNMRYEMAPPQYNPEPQQNVSREMEDDLIDVSDDDLSDDSREVSDDEEEDDSDNEESKISVDNSETIPLSDDEVKKIVVPMVSNESVNLEETPLEEVTDSLDEIDDDDDEVEENNVTLETVNLTPEVIEVVKKNDTDVSVEDLLENLNGNNENKETQQDELDELDELDDLDDDSEDEEEEDEIDYSKLKVSELKALAKEKGLTNYKSLKKAPLVELLKSSE